MIMHAGRIGLRREMHDEEIQGIAPTSAFAQDLLRAGLEVGYDAHLESYPEETFLRVRISERTVLLNRLSPLELELVRSSPESLTILAIIHLQRSEGL